MLSLVLSVTATVPEAAASGATARARAQSVKRPRPYYEPGASITHFPQRGRGVNAP